MLSPEMCVSMHPEKHSSSQPSLQVIQYMMAILDEKPDMYLDELAMDPFETLGVSVSLSTIHCSLQLLGYTRKQV